MVSQYYKMYIYKQALKITCLYVLEALCLSIFSQYLTKILKDQGIAHSSNINVKAIEKDNCYNYAILLQGV